MALTVYTSNVPSTEVKWPLIAYFNKAEFAIRVDQSVCPSVHKKVTMHGQAVRQNLWNVYWPFPLALITGRGGTTEPKWRPSVGLVWPFPQLVLKPFSLRDTYLLVKRSNWIQPNVPKQSFWDSSFLRICHDCPFYLFRTLKIVGF